MQKMGWWQAHCILYTQLCEEARELEAGACQSNMYYLRVTSSTCKNMSQFLTHVLTRPVTIHPDHMLQFKRQNYTVYIEQNWTV